MGLLPPTSQVNSYWTQDPYWAYVELLLHGEGANGGSTITDSSSRNRTATVNGATTSTVQKKFGNASILGGASNTFTFALGSGGSMTGDFTFEMFLRDGGGNIAFFSEADYPTTYNYFYYQTSAGAANWKTQAAGNLLSSIDGFASGWHHYAFCRTGTSLRCYVDGVLGPSATNAATIDLRTLTFGYFKPNGNLYWAGYWDEVRVTKGICRYTANFTAPILQFPDS